MSGRAGRRGLDDRGIVIMMFDEKLEPPAAKQMVKGEADRLNSAFHLGYNMVLNLMRVEGISPEYMLERCFFQFQNAASVPGMEAELEALEAARDAIEVPEEEAVSSYYELRKQLDQFNKDLQEVITHPSYSLPFLQPGRLVRVKHEQLDFGWGVVINYQKRLPQKGKPIDPNAPPQTQYIVDCLLQCAAGSTVPKGRNNAAVVGSLQPPEEGTKGELLAVPVLLSTIDSISGIRIFIPKDLRPAEPREQLRKNILEVKRRFLKGIPLLDPVKDMKITDEGFKQLLGVSSPVKTRPFCPLLTYCSVILAPENRGPRTASQGKPIAWRRPSACALRNLRSQGRGQGSRERDASQDCSGSQRDAAGRAQVS